MTNQEPLILAIESAVAGGSISLLRGGVEIAGWSGTSDLSRAEDILPAIDELLNGKNISSQALGMIAASAGPGSFTGIRIGLSTAMGLAAGLDIPFSSVNVLRAMSTAVANERVTTAIPMGRHSICVQTFDNSIERPTQDEMPISMADTELDSYVRQHDDHQFVIHGALSPYCTGTSNVTSLGDRLSELIGRYCAQNPGSTEAPIFITKAS